MEKICSHVKKMVNCRFLFCDVVSYVVQIHPDDFKLSIEIKRYYNAPIGAYGEGRFQCNFNCPW